MAVKRGSTVAAIDVGSTKVAVVVGDIGDRGEMRVLGVGVAPASGLSRGVIDNIQSAREAIATAVQKAEQSCGMRILSAVAGVSGAHIQSQNNRGIVAIPDRHRPISVDDRTRVIETAGQISIPPTRQVIHIIPRGYWVEGTDQVSDPLGMYGGRLDAETHIVSGSATAIQNLTKCIEGAGVQVDELVLEALASATSVLTDQERKHGVALLDIGGSTTSIAVYDEGTIAHTACLPIAGSQLTNDLARVLRCPWESAEMAKCEYGAAFAEDSMNGENVEIRAFGTHPQKLVPLRHVCEILEARVDEMLEAVEIELKRVGYLDRIGAGIVLTGGSSQLRGLAEMAEERLKLPARIGVPLRYSGLTDLIGTPAYATAIGLTQYALRHQERTNEVPAQISRFDHLSRGGGGGGEGGGFMKRLASFGRALMPQ